MLGSHRSPITSSHLSLVMSPFLDRLQLHEGKDHVYLVPCGPPAPGMEPGIINIQKILGE